MSPLLECRDVACGYHGCAVLEGVSLAIQPGESVALLGPNGSGKSTLLKTVGKLVPPMTGAVLLEGEDVRQLGHQEVARRVAYVPQEETTDFPFLVREIVAMGRIPHAKGLMDTAEDREITEEAMRTADCAQLADRPITELSGGERQRVLIARALAQESPLLLLDEPTWKDCYTIDEEGRQWHAETGFPLFSWSSMARGYFAEVDDPDVKRVYDNMTSRARRSRATELGKRYGATPPQVVLAWVLNQPGNVFALCGLRTVENVTQSLEALDLKLSPDELCWLERGDELGC